MAPPAPAADRTWTGGGGGDNTWDAAANWQGGATPTASDNVIFDNNSAGNLNNTNDFGAGILSNMSFALVDPPGPVAIAGNSIGLTANNPAVDMSAATNSLIFGCPLVAPVAAHFNVANGRSLFIHSFSGPGDVFKHGEGSLVVDADWLNTGSTTINAGTMSIRANVSSTNYTINNGGTITLNQANVLPDTSSVNVAIGGTFNLNDNNETIGSLSGDGDCLLGAGDLTFGDANNTSFGGMLGGNFNAGNVTKQGSGKFTLSAGTGIIFTAGAVMVTGGVFQLDGASTSFGFAVFNGATLMGGGTVLIARATFVSGATFAPGSSAGTMILDGGLKMNAGSNLNIEISGTTAGANHDQIFSGGAVDLGGCNLNLTLGYTPAKNDSYTIIDNQSGAAITDTFNGLPEGELFLVDGNQFQITYMGGDGDDVVITCITPAPAAPSAPTAIGATGIGQTGFTANWNKVDGAASYILQVACDWAFTDFGWGGFASLNAGDASSYEVTGLRSGWTYLYRVKAVSNAGSSGWSNVIKARTLDSEGGQPTTKPDPPNVTEGSSSSPGLYSDGVRISWGSGSSPSAMAASSGVTYRVYRAESLSGEKTLLGETAQEYFDDKTAKLGVIYYYWITAVNALGESAFSNYVVGWRYDKNPGRYCRVNAQGAAGLSWWACQADCISAWGLDGVTLIGQSPSGRAGLGDDWLIKAMADFDGDKISDVLWFNRATGEIRVWLVNPMSCWAASSTGLSWLVKDSYTIAATGSGYYLVKTADFNGDGRADIFLRGYGDGSQSIWLTQADGTVAAGPPAFAPGVEYVEQEPVDFNPSSQAGLPQTSGSMGWQAAGFADFNGDGKADVLWRDPLNGRLAIWLMDGQSIIAAGWMNTPNHEGWRIKGIGDLDGDARADLLWRHETTAGLRAWFMDQMSVKNRGALSTAEPAQTWLIKAMGDFDGDGKDDIYWRDQATGQVRIWIMDGLEVNSSGSPGTAGDFD